MNPKLKSTELEGILFDFLPLTLIVLKGINVPPTPPNDTIIHSRHILSTITDKELKSISHHCKKEFFPLFPFVWITSILKDEQYLTDFIPSLYNHKNQSLIGSFFITSLLIYETELAIDQLTKLAKSETWQGSIAIHCLQKLDKKRDTNYSTKFEPQALDFKTNRFIDSIISYTNILIGGLEYETPNEFQEKMCIILNETTPPHKFHFMHYAPVNTISDFKKFHSTLIKGQDLNPITSSIPNSAFSAAVGSYLTNQPEADSTYKLALALNKANSYADLLAGIEMDLDCKLPIKIVDLCFEKLLTLINGSFQLYEQYAVQLLMRGTALDQKAEKLYATSQTIKKKYKYIEPVFTSYDLQGYYTL